MKERLNPEGLYSGPGFSQVVTASGGTTVYVSGQIAVDAAAKPVGGDDIGRQADRALENLELAVAAAGGEIADLVALRIYVVDLTPERAMAVFESLIRLLGERPPPAVTMLGVAALALPGLAVEVEAVAVVE